MDDKLRNCSSNFFWTNPPNVQKETDAPNRLMREDFIFFFFFFPNNIHTLIKSPPTVTVSVTAA